MEVKPAPQGNGHELFLSSGERKVVGAATREEIARKAKSGMLDHTDVQAVACDVRFSHLYDTPEATGVPEAVDAGTLQYVADVTNRFAENTPAAVTDLIDRTGMPPYANGAPMNRLELGSAAVTLAVQLRVEATVLGLSQALDEQSSSGKALE